MAGVDHLVVYMRTAVNYKAFYIHYSGGAQHPLVVFYSSFQIHHQMVHTNYFPIFLSPNPVVVNKTSSQERVCLVGKTLVDPVGVFCARLGPTNAHIRQIQKNDRK